MTDDNRRNRTGPTAIGAALRLVTDIAIPDSITAMSDEEWAAHDARVANVRDRARRSEDDKRTAVRSQALLEAGFPRRAVTESMRADEGRSALARIKAWDPSERSVLVISGDKGCGKTVAATWWSRRQVFTPRFLRASTFAASSRYDSDARSAWLSAPALVLDDLGTEFLDSSGSFLVDLDELIDVFYGDQRPLIVTTNLKIDQFKARYGARIEDRMRECAVFFSAIGGSMRGQS